MGCLLLQDIIYIYFFIYFVYAMQVSNLRLGPYKSPTLTTELMAHMPQDIIRLKSIQEQSIQMSAWELQRRMQTQCVSE